MSAYINHISRESLCFFLERESKGRRFCMNSVELLWMMNGVWPDDKVRRWPAHMWATLYIYFVTRMR